MLKTEATVMIALVCFTCDLGALGPFMSMTVLKPLVLFCHSIYFNWSRMCEDFLRVHPFSLEREGR